MVIAEITTEGKIIPLEELKKPNRIGQDTFATGKISVETIHDTCDILCNFKKVMTGYQIKNYRAVATSGIREAMNQEYIIEQIRLRTGLIVEVISNSEERLLSYKAIRDYIPDSKRIRNEGTMIVDVGSGDVEISIYSEGNLQFTEYLKVGSLRLREILVDLEKMTLNFPAVVEEYVESKTKLIKPFIQDKKIKNFIGLSGELRNIYKICSPDKNSIEEKFIPKEIFQKFYSQIRTMTTEQIMREIYLDYKQAKLLLPSTIVFHIFLEMTCAKGIYVPMVSLRHGILADIVDQWFDTSRKHDFLNDIITSVWYIGKKFGIDKIHANHVEKLALSIFDQTIEQHSLGERERLYLQIAAILHDVGKFETVTGHSLHSYNIIRSQNIMGFSERELNLIASITRYHGTEDPKMFHENYRIMTFEDKILVSKLVAILKLADALDASHKQKIKEVKISQSENKRIREIYFTIQTWEDVLLERWSFGKKATFFEEVMGNKLHLRIKGEENEKFI